MALYNQAVELIPPSSKITLKTLIGVAVSVFIRNI